MTTLDIPAIGDRIRRYRRLNSESAADLARRAGNGLTQEILTKIENGKRQDIGIRQLWAIADALCVPLIALLVPLARPHDLVGDDQTVSDVLAEQLSWNAHAPLPAAKEAHTQLATLRTYEALRHDLVDALSLSADRTEDEAIAARRAAHLALREQEALMRTVGIEEA